MARSRTKNAYICGACGNETAKWEGKCYSCDEWNTITKSFSGRRYMGASSEVVREGQPAVELSEVSSENVHRLGFSFQEVNRVLGSGIVPGSIVAIAGDPGIGKSTLLLHMASDVASSGRNSLYITGEESIAQLKIRAERLGIVGERLVVLHASELEEILGYLAGSRPDFVVVDSIQTVYSEDIGSAVGSLAQIRECTRVLMEWGKTNTVPIILSGHVTKGGDIAGPKALEHMVDVVLYMEGDPVGSWRLLRAVKNRFGSTNEVGVFEMTDHGLVEVSDPSSTFMSDRTQGTVGSVVVATIEGSRSMLVEVQALTSPTAISVPRRVATGIDVSRLLLICAVLTKKVGLPLVGQDVVVNVAGGLRITEPAADLGVALAIASSLRNVPVMPHNVAVAGEIGLTGEVRSVPQMERRFDEVSRLGLTQFIVPGSWRQGSSNGVAAVPVSTLTDALAMHLPAQRS